MKFLHICETATGGVGTYQRLFTQSPALGAASVFVMPDEHADFFGRTMPGLRPYRGGRSAGGTARMIAATRRAIREERPDVIFCHSSFSLLALAGLALDREARGIPRIYCSHGYAISRFEDPASAKARVVRAAEGRLCGLADRVVDISQFEYELARSLGYRGRHQVIENAVADRVAVAATAPFERTDEDEIHLLFVGRFDRQKGVDILIDAFEKARRSRPGLRLHLIGGEVVGDQPLAVPPSIDRVGWVGADAIDSWYAACNALVMPSRWEGFGLVAAEAYRNGLPVLASDVGALPDVVEDGVTGRIFAHDRLADLLATVTRDDLGAMRPAALQRYRSRFTIDRWRGEIEALVTELLGERR